jgi:hypothetical protein
MGKRLTLGSIGLGLLLSAACVRRIGPPPERPEAYAPPPAVTLRAVWEALLDFPLTTQSPPVHILYALWARGRGWTLLDPRTGRSVSPLEFLLRGTHRPDYPLRGGIVGSEHGRPYFVFGQKGLEGEQRPCLFLARLAELGVPLDERVRDDQGTVYTLGNVVDWAQWTMDAARCARRNEEVGEVLVAFTEYLPLGAQWTNREGHRTRVEDFLAVALQKPLGQGECAGTHELYGLAYAWRKWRQQRPRQPPSPLWRRVERRLRQAVRQLWKTQNPDGSVTLDWHRSAREPRSPLEVLHAGGHHLDWLTLFLDERELDQEACRRLVRRLFEVARRYGRAYPQEVEIRAHAAHALHRYWLRHGPRL